MEEKMRPPQFCRNQSCLIRPGRSAAIQIEFLYSNDIDIQLSDAICDSLFGPSPIPAHASVDIVGRHS